MKEYKAPESYSTDGKPSIFLAGSIEMGTADDWQAKVCKILKNKDIVILNPRRLKWDPTWEQRMSNPKFTEQVVWELDSLGSCDAIMLYFDPTSKAPISLLELGLCCNADKLIVMCPDGYWRKGNVEIVCDRFDVPMVDTFEELVEKTYQLAVKRNSKRKR